MAKFVMETLSATVARGISTGDLKEWLRAASAAHALSGALSPLRAHAGGVVERISCVVVELPLRRTQRTQQAEGVKEPSALEIGRLTVDVEGLRLLPVLLGGSNAPAVEGAAAK